MERPTSYIEGRHFCIGDLYAFGISVGIELATDCKTFFRRGVCDQFDHEYRLTRGMERQFWVM